MFLLIVLKNNIRIHLTFSKQVLREGNIAFISQSGALTAGVLDYAKDKNIGFSKVIAR